MPILNKNYTLEITPEQFLNACSRNELIELQMLLDSPHYRKKTIQDDDADNIEKYKALGNQSTVEKTINFIKADI